MSDSDVQSVGMLEKQVKAFDDRAADTMEADERMQLAETLVALADAYGSRGEFDAEAATIDRLEAIRCDESAVPVHESLATALANATAVADRDEVYATGIEPTRIETHRARLETLYGSQPTQSIAMSLARATAQTAHAYGKAEQPDRIEPLLDRLESIYADQSATPIAASLANGYARAELYQVDIEGTPDPLERVEELHETHSTGSVAAGVAGVIAGRTNADVNRNDIETIEQRIARIEMLGQQYPAVETEMERWLQIAAANATRASFEVADYERIQHWAGRTIDAHENLSTATSGTWAALATFYSARGSFFDGDVEAGERKLDRLRQLEAQYENPVFEHWLARCLFDAARGYAETGHYDRARSMADELSTYAEGHEDREQIEAGLEALRRQAPGLFGESEAGESVGSGSLADGAASVTQMTATDSVETSAEQRQGSSQPATATPVDATEIVAETQELTEAIEMLDRPEQSGDSCGSGGCGECGQSHAQTGPASTPVLVAALLTSALVVFSLLYGLYRLMKVGAAVADTTD